jgi:hypothetical protein
MCHFDVTPDSSYFRKRTETSGLETAADAVPASVATTKAKYFMLLLLVIVDVPGVPLLFRFLL